MNKDLLILKKNYGENFAKLCRELFPSLLEIEGLLPNLILSKFSPNHYLYDDIINNKVISDFKNYIYSLVDIKNKLIKSEKTVKELLSEAGYNFFECKSEKDIQKYKKYYKKNETLCTFQGGRLNSCYVFFAIKKDVNNIKRNSFKEPKRQDEYGTSVISIQFTKGDINTLSIKNRYNHTVKNPDATFSNNLENIISGLTYAFEKEYHLNIVQNNSKEFELNKYVIANDGKYYKYNYEINNIYYCPNNIIINHGKVNQLEKEKYLMIDYFILDLVNKKIKVYDKNLNDDSFIGMFSNIEYIEIEKNKKNKNKLITIKKKGKEDTKIEIDKYGNLISLEDNNLIIILDNFLYFNESLEYILCNSVKKIGDEFLYKNNSLKEIYLPNLIKVKSSFLYHNNSLEIINFPKLENSENNFLKNNQVLKTVNLPSLMKVGRNFLKANQNIVALNLPNLKIVGSDFLYSNTCLKELITPNLMQASINFLRSNQSLRILYLPNLKIAGACFLYRNSRLKVLICPKLTSVGKYFLCHNKSLKIYDLASLKKESSFFLASNYYYFNPIYQKIVKKRVKYYKKITI